MKTLRRLLLGLVAIALLVAGAAYAFRETVTAALFRIAAERALTRDLVAELPDGIHVFVCGSGSPFADPERAGPCLGVLAGERAFVFDVGSGAARRLGQMGFPMERLEAVYLTHLHSDHFDGLGELMLQAWIVGRRDTPLPLRGPFGVTRIADGLNEAYAIDSRYRVTHHGPEVAKPGGYGVAASSVHRAHVLEEGDLRISAFAVNHAPVEPAFGFRIDYKGRSVVISGDTAYDARVVAAAKGTDVLFHEALQPKLTRVMGEIAAAQGRAAFAKIFDDIEDYHATPEEAARAAAQARVGHLVIYHLVPSVPPFMTPAFLGDAADAFQGPITVAEDGMLISVPADFGPVEIAR